MWTRVSGWPRSQHNSLRAHRVGSTVKIYILIIKYLNPLNISTNKTHPDHSAPSFPVFEVHWSCEFPFYPAFHIPVSATSRSPSPLLPNHTKKHLILSTPRLPSKQERDPLTPSPQHLPPKPPPKMRPPTLLLLLTTLLPALTTSVHINTWLTKDCSGTTDSTSTFPVDGGCMAIDRGAWTLSYTTDVDCFFTMYADKGCTERAAFTVLDGSCLLPGFKVWGVRCGTVWGRWRGRGVWGEGSGWGGGMGGCLRVCAEVSGWLGFGGLDRENIRLGRFTWGSNTALSRKKQNSKVTGTKLVQRKIQLQAHLPRDLGYQTLNPMATRVDEWSSDLKTTYQSWSTLGAESNWSELCVRRYNVLIELADWHQLDSTNHSPRRPWTDVGTLASASNEKDLQNLGMV